MNDPCCKICRHSVDINDKVFDCKQYPFKKTISVAKQEGREGYHNTLDWYDDICDCERFEDIPEYITGRRDYRGAPLLVQ